MIQTQECLFVCCFLEEQEEGFPSDSLVIIKIMSKLQAMSSASARLRSICFLMQYANLAGPAFKLTPQFARLIQLLRK